MESVVAAPAPSPVAPPPTATARPAAPSTVRVESDPSGVTVRMRDRDGEELCKETPCQITLKADAAVGSELKLHFSKKGFGSETKTFKVGDDKVTIKLGKKTVGKGTLKNGKVTITLTKPLKKGKNKLVASYAGDSSFAASKVKLTITIT